jgi:hypothetical protein
MIKTPAGHSITFDDSEARRSVTIQDANGSTVVLDSTTGDVTIRAKRNLSLSATGTVSISSDADITVAAKNTVNLEAAAEATKITMTATSVDIT